MGEIPEDAFAAARKAYDEQPVRIRDDLALGTLLIAFARAILAERERCAKIAEHMLKFADTTSAADVEIAAAIRKGPAP